MRKYLLEIIVFIGGLAIMVLELVGARVLTPYVGTSILVWSSLIGVILGCLSLGYWWGGKFADKGPNYKNFSLVILFSAVLVGLTAFLKTPVLNFLQEKINEVRLESILATLILFGPASFFLASISPYAVRLKIADLGHSGRTVGSLYAISTVGSIVGTFLTGFLLIPYLGNLKIILSLCALLFFASLLACFKNLLKEKIGLLIFIILFIPFANSYEKRFWPEDTIFISSPYSDIIISEASSGQRPILVLSTDLKYSQSAMFLDNDDDLVFPILKFFRLAGHFNPDIKKSLMLGGAAYSFPKDYLKKYPEATMDVVEIDPQMTQVAKQYFNLEDDPRLTIYHQDARVFLNRTEKKYDAVFIDVFKTFFVPYQLTTLEAIDKIYGALNDNGVVMVNIVSSIDGETGKFVRAEYATYKEVFPYVYLLPVAFSRNSERVQNIALLAIKSDKEPLFSSADAEMNKCLSHVWEKEIEKDVPMLTDDYAPVDHYLTASF